MNHRIKRSLPGYKFLVALPKMLYKCHILNRVLDNITNSRFSIISVVLVINKSSKITLQLCNVHPENDLSRL
ncbi:hypothetical protein RIF29_32545 [Crotalaria pallida]|uniref:Uncharacterized protein n=1 Tax=Crotalaria pallida TaxID=3830 RepID=A0AAN9EJ20_CROPI